MYCTKCRTQLPDNANFCGNCGTPVVKTAQQPPKKKDSCFGRFLKFVGIAAAVIFIIAGNSKTSNNQPTTTEQATATPRITATQKPTATPRITSTQRPTATPKPTATPIPPDVVAMMMTSKYARAGIDETDVRIEGDKVVAYFAVNGLGDDVDAVSKTKDQELLKQWVDFKEALHIFAQDIENAFLEQGAYYPCRVVAVDDRDGTMRTPLVIVENGVTLYDITTDK